MRRVNPGYSQSRRPPPEHDVRETRRPRDAVAVVPDRVDRGVVAEPLVEEHLQRPPRPLRDGEGGGAVPRHARPRGIFEKLARAPDIPGELLAGLPRDHRVPEAVAGDLVPRGGDPFHEPPVPLRHPPQDEEGGPDAAGGEDVEDAPDLRLAAALQTLPSRGREKPGERLRLEPLLDVEAERVDGVGKQMHSLPSRRMHGGTEPAVAIGGHGRTRMRIPPPIPHEDPRREGPVSPCAPRLLCGNVQRFMATAK